MAQVKKWFVAGWLAMVLSSVASADDFQKGVEAYGDGDYPTAIKVFTPLAEKDKNPRAQFNLGLLYDHEKDYKQSEKWYKLAAENGVTQAQFNLGLKYNNGEGIEKDVKKAMNWWRKAAENGHAQAQYNLGVKYIEGDGVPPNIEEAVKWTRNAAEQGYVLAQFNLGLLYKEEGAKQDYILAYKWLDITTAQEDKALATIAEEILDKLAERMTDEQIAEAQEIAQQCLANDYKDC